MTEFKINKITGGNVSILTAVKWVAGHIVVWVVLFILWVMYCFASTASEAGQAMGLAMGAFIITFGLLLSFFATGLYLWYKKSMSGFIFLGTLFCLCLGIFAIYYNFMQQYKQFDKQFKDYELSIAASTTTYHEFTAGENKVESMKGG